MKTTEFLPILRRHPGHHVAFALPDGSPVPAHFHITEVGYQSKTFLDCGGLLHSTGACLLQAWVADDTAHRLEASKLLAIFDRAAELLPAGPVPVEIETEAPVLTQLPVTSHAIADGTIVFQLAHKHTDCLAKDICIPDLTLPPLPGGKACSPASGCC